MLLRQTHSNRIHKAASDIPALVIKERLECRGQPGSGPCHTQAHSGWKCDPSLDLFMYRGPPEDPLEP